MVCDSLIALFSIAEVGIFGAVESVMRPSCSAGGRPTAARSRVSRYARRWWYTSGGYFG